MAGMDLEASSYTDNNRITFVNCALLTYLLTWRTIPVLGPMS